MNFMSCHKGPKRRQFRVASVSLRGDLRQGERPWMRLYHDIVITLP